MSSSSKENSLSIDISLCSSFLSCSGVHCLGACWSERLSASCCPVWALGVLALSSATAELAEYSAEDDPRSCLMGPWWSTRDSTVVRGKEPAAGSAFLTVCDTAGRVDVSFAKRLWCTRLPHLAYLCKCEYKVDFCGQCKDLYIDVASAWFYISLYTEIQDH